MNVVVLYKCSKVTDMSQQKSILHKNGCCFFCLEKVHLMENCSVNYQCNNSKGKHNTMICEGCRKHDPNIKKDSNIIPPIPDKDTLTTYDNADNT